ncbi:hypothetical protein [Streptomyces sp. NPDC005209]|uniref:hypothetical protein n=1 Tax=Streptomyces sp. NPDC005209 TaxID=3156715 RepID=UPI0033BEF7B4
MVNTEAASSVDASALLGLATRMQQLLTDADHLVAVPATPLAYRDAEFRFDGPLDAVRAGAHAEFSELVNRVPTQPVWSPPGTPHLWDVYGEVLAADLAHSSLTPQERQRYDAASAYLYVTDASGTPSPSRALLDYRAARQAWLQADTDYHQGEQTASMSPDPAVRDHWAHVDEPRLRQIRDDAMEAWQTGGHKAQVEDALRETSELASKAPSSIWKRHRDTFNPNLPDQFSTAPNGIRYAPTYYSPAGALDMPWSRVVLPRQTLLTLAEQAPPELTAALGGGIDPTVQSLAFDYRVVSVVRPWLDPPMELFGSRAWQLSPSVTPLSDGGSPPHGRCPAYVESVALARSLDLTRLVTDSVVASQGDTALKGTWTFDFDTGEQGGDMFYADVWWEWMTQSSAQLVPNGRASIVNLGVRDFGSLTVDQLAAFTYGKSPVPGNPDGSNQLVDGDVFAVATSEGNFAKVLVVKYGYNMLIRWVTYRWTSPREDHAVTGPDDVFLAAFVCRRLPRCPDPDPGLTW